MIYAVSAIIVILLLLYIMPVNSKLSFVKENNNGSIKLELRTLYGLLNLKTEIPFLITFENGMPELKFKFELPRKRRRRLPARFAKLIKTEEGGGLGKAYKKYKDKLLPVMKYIGKKTKIDDFSLRLTMGTGDAAETGILYGTAWIVIGNFMAFTGSYLKINNPKIVIVPVFNRIQFSVDFSCIIRIKTGHIIIAGIKALPFFLHGSDKKIQINIY